jgi:hypothetical protein
MLPTLNRPESRYVLRAAIVLLLMAVAAPWVVRGAFRSLETMYNAPVQWMRKDFPQRRDLDQFTADFQVSDTLILSWPGCTIDDERLARFARALLDVQQDRARQGMPELVAEVSTGYGAVRRLMAEPLGMTRLQATTRLSGILVGPDGQTSAAAIGLTLAGRRSRDKTIDMILDVAVAQVGLARDEFHLAGGIVDGEAIDREALRSVRQLVLPSALVCLLVAWYFLRSWPLTLGILCVAAFGEGAVLLSLYWAGVTMNAVLSVLAPLAFVLAISLGIHLANYYLNELREGNSETPVRRAVRAARWPCAMCAVTSILGFNALNVSEIQPVQQFGLFSSLAVALTALLLFGVVPGAMQIDLWRRQRRGRGLTPAEGPVVDRRETFWEWLVGPLCRYAGTVTFATLALMVAAGIGLRWVQTSVDVNELLDEDNRVLQDYRWLEENIGPLVSAEIIVNFAADSPYDALERLDLVRRVQADVDRINGGHRSLSAATFLPEIPPPGGLRQTMRRTAVGQHVEQEIPAFVQRHLIHVDAARQSWRIAARLPAMQNIDYGVFLAQLQAEIEPLVAPHAAQGVSLTFTGLMPMVYAAQRELLRDMLYSFLAAFGAIALAMIVVQRNVGLGLLAMIPNIFPAVIAFGTMGWLGIRVDIGTMMTASVAIGIAVDDAIHFLAWYRKELVAGHTSYEAVRSAARHCGWAMFQTTAICGLGMIVFALSGFVPTRRFAWMMSSLLTVAVVGNLVLLPPLLVGPLGRRLIGRLGRTASPDPSSAQAPAGTSASADGHG